MHYLITIWVPGYKIPILDCTITSCDLRLFQLFVTTIFYGDMAPVNKCKIVKCGMVVKMNVFIRNFEYSARSRCCIVEGKCWL